VDLALKAASALALDVRAGAFLSTHGLIAHPPSEAFQGLSPRQESPERQAPESVETLDFPRLIMFSL
jgi:hypothetical protein